MAALDDLAETYTLSEEPLVAIPDEVRVQKKSYGQQVLPQQQVRIAGRRVDADNAVVTLPSLRATYVQHMELNVYYNGPRLSCRLRQVHLVAFQSFNMAAFIEQFPVVPTANIALPSEPPRNIDVSEIAAILSGEPDIFS